MPELEMYGLTWRRLTPADEAAAEALVERCHAADAGPSAVSTFGAHRFGSKHCAAIGGFVGEQLVAAVTVVPAASYQPVIGYVDPGYRGRGLGGAVLDWGLREAGGASEIQTRVLTPGAQALFESRGFALTTAEDTMTLTLTRSAPMAAPELPAGFTLRRWRDGTASEFWMAHTTIFTGDDSAAASEVWKGWELVLSRTYEDEIHSSLLAYAPDGTPAAIVLAYEGTIYQAATAAQWRRRGLGRALVLGASAHYQAEVDAQYPEDTDDTLVDVTFDALVAGSTAFFERLGFRHTAREASFRPGR